MCPGDLMVKDMRTGKAYLRSAEDCWDCLPCVKVCPEEAIEFRLSYQLGYQTAKLVPHIHKSRDFITWELTDTQGNVENFKIRTKVLAVDLDEKVEGVTPPEYAI
jgi:adenylylsulfate reductase subunit B